MHERLLISLSSGLIDPSSAGGSSGHIANKGEGAHGGDEDVEMEDAVKKKTKNTSKPSGTLQMCV